MKQGREFELVISYLRQYRALVALCVCLLIFSSFFEGIGLTMMVPILQSIEGGGAPNVFTRYTKLVLDKAHLPFTFLTLIALLAVVMIGRYVLSGLVMHLTRMLSANVAYDMRRKAFRNIMSVPMSYYHTHKVGDIIATLYTSVQNAAAVMELAVMFIVDIVFCAVYILVSLFISAKLTLVVYLLAAFSFFLIIPRFKEGYIHGKDEKRVTDEMSSFLVDKLGGIKLVKTYQNENLAIAAFDLVACSYRRLVIKIQEGRIVVNLLLEPLVMVLALCVAGYATLVLRMPIAMLIAFFYIISRVIPRVRLINTNWLQIVNYLPHFSVAGNLVEIDERYRILDGEKEIGHIISGIRFDHVSFQYNDKAGLVLKDLTLLFERNKTTALIGGSGGGKTTIVDLVTRLYEAVSGRILVDNIDLKDIRLASWGRLVAAVEQEPYLFYDTIANNIRYGKPDSTDEEVRNAASLAYAGEFIEKLPYGYATVVGERGHSLSGGQRQRIALARALIKNPELLILDEATSALDSESESFIRATISQLRNTKTIIIVAHRLSTVAGADKLVVIEDGRVIEEGNPKELLEREGFYKKYHALQGYGHDGENRVIPTLREKQKR